jgi:hypothetical protein
MAIQTINIGNIVNDGLGDDLRTAFQKVNGNFAELSASLTVTASNLGTIGEDVFAQKVGNNLEFRKLVAGNKIQLTSSIDNILIESTVPDAFIQITTNNGIARASDSQFLTIQGGEEVTVSAVGSTIQIDTNIGLNDIFTVLDFGYVDQTYDNTVQFNTSVSNVDFGTFTNPGRITVDLGTFSGA